MTFDRPGADEYNAYYAGYVSRVPDGKLRERLGRQLAEWQELVHAMEDDAAGQPPTPGKWSAKDVLLHVIDAERVFAYRMLRAARGDDTPLASFDQDAYAAAGRASMRSLSSLLEELRAVRAATIALLDSLAPEAHHRRVVASLAPVSVRALAWIITGHDRHHLDGLRAIHEGGGVSDSAAARV